MNILVTGGAGFIGSHTVDRLIEMGHSVRILDSLSEPVHKDKEVPSYLNPKAEFILGDVCDEETLLECLDNIDVVFHLAAFQDYLPYFSKFVDVNIKSTALIYELIHKYMLPVRKVIVASSQSTLGEGLYLDANGDEVLPDMRSDDDLRNGIWDPKTPEGFVEPITFCKTPETISNPKNAYGMSKIAEEQFALNLGKRYNVPSVALRYSIVQGSRQSFRNAYSGACRIFSLAFNRGEEPVIYEDGNQVRDFVNIHDVVDANILVMEDDRANYEMFNIGGDQLMNINDFAKVVADVFEYDNYTPKASGSYRFGDTRHCFSDISKIKSLGWSPKRSVRESVAEYKLWLDSNDVEDISQKCDEVMKNENVVRETID